MRCKKEFRMKLLKHSLVAAALIATTATTSMADVTVSLDPMMMGVFGNDVHAGDVYTYDYSGGTGYYYQYDGDPIISKPDSKFAWRGEVEYTKGDWGVGVNYWGLNSTGDNSGSVTDPNPSDSSYVGIRIGDAGWSTDSAANRIDWGTSNKIRVWSSDIYGIKKIMDSNDNTFNLTFGLKLAKLENQRKDFMQYNSSSYDSTVATYTYNWDNSSKSNLLIGPMMGVQGHFHWQKQRVVGTVSQSFIYGGVDYASATTEAYSYNTYDYRYATSHKVNEVIPVTDIKLKWMYDITPKVAVGLGAYGSMWFNAPMAQESGSYYYGNTSNKKTVIFAGALGSLEFKF